MIDTALVNDVSNWLIEHGRLLSVVGRSQGLPNTADLQHHRAEHLDDNPGGASFTAQPMVETVTSWVLTSVRQAIGDHLGEGFFDRANEIVNELDSAFPDTITYEYGHAVPAFFASEFFRENQFDRSAGLIALRYRGRALLLQALNECMWRQAGLHTFDGSSVEQVVSELVAFAASADVDWVAIIPVGGFKVEHDLHVEGLTVRPLDPSELGEFVEPFDDLAMSRLRPQLNPSMNWWVHIRNGIEHRTTQPKSARSCQPLVVRKFLLALQLLGYEPCGEEVGVSYTQPFWPTREAQPFPILLPKYPRDVRVLDEARFIEAVELANLISDTAVSTIESPTDLFLHRFVTGCSRDTDSEAIIDFAVSLEGVLLGEVRDELRYRFAVGGAVFLADDVEDRESLFQDLRSVYDMRSSLVHARTKWPPSDKIASVKASAHQLAARTLTKCLREGWPSDDDLRLRLFT